MSRHANPAQPMTQLDLTDLAATEKLGRLIAAHLSAGDVVALGGDLGAGKTTLARAIIGALCSAQEAPSPTFTLVQTYSCLVRGRQTEIWHFDLYRLTRPEEAYDLAIEDAFAGGISLIEWPDRLGTLLPADRLQVTLTILGPTARRAVLSGGPKWRVLLSAVETEMAA